MSVATGLAIGQKARPELAQTAVAQAMQQIGATTANSVLLLLTSEFARDPVPALRAAARAANCTQVIGCSATGIFTDQDWVVDAPAAAVMVMTGDLALLPEPEPQPDTLLLALAAPSAINTTWLGAPGRRFGGISGDATGQGPFSVWRSGKGAATGHCEFALSGAAGVVGAAHGVQVLSEAKPVTAGHGYDVMFLGGKPALETLQYAYSGIDATDPLPLHNLMAGIADNADELRLGHYRLAALVCANESDRSVTLARPVEPGQQMFWALRDTGAAQQDMQRLLNGLQGQLAATPEFGLMFSCLGRGPYFYSGVDRDLELVRKALPGMPFIGFYGNGEIAPLNGTNELLQYSAVLGLFHEHI